MCFVILSCQMLGSSLAAEDKADAFAAQSCAKVATYVDEISSIIIESTSGKINDYGRLLDRKHFENIENLRLFEIVAGKEGRFFGFEDADGIYGMEQLAKACTAEMTCDEKVVSVIRGFAYFLIQACKSDYQGS